MIPDIEPCTPKQATVLQQRGIDPAHHSKKSASALIGELPYPNSGQQSASGQTQQPPPSTPHPQYPQQQAPNPANSSRPCTPKQAGLLAKYGFSPDQFTFSSASAKIDEIAAQGWPEPEQYVGAAPATVPASVPPFQFQR